MDNSKKLQNNNEIRYVQYNKGYKNCKKNEKIDCSSKDLIDAYLHIFKFTIHLNEPILILEDEPKLYLE